MENVGEFSDSPQFLPIGRLILKKDESTKYTAQVSGFSEATHRTITKEDAFATQAKADAILSEMQNFVYQPYEAKYVEADMRAEVGDGVQILDKYSMIGNIGTTCDVGGVAEMSAPQSEEETHEFQYENKSTLKQDRINYNTSVAISDANTRIDQTNTAITLEATARSNEDTALSGRITVNANNISSKVSKGSVISEINQSAEAVTINANKVNLNGYVTMTNLATAGQTSVNGSNIQSGTITLGGNGNGNGQMRIVDTNNVEIGTWTNTGIRILDDTSDIQTQLYSKFKICRAGDDSDGCFIGCGQPYNSAHPGTFPNESVPTLLLIGKEDSSIRGSISLVPILGCTFDRTSIEFTNGSELFGVNSGGTNEAIGWDSTGMYYQRIDSGGITKKYFKNLTGW